MSSDDLEKRADRTLHGLDPKNTVYLHGFDQVCMPCVLFWNLLYIGIDQDQAKYGELYADQVKSMFREATVDVDSIHLTFEGARIFVEFDKKDEAMSMTSHMEGVNGGNRNMTGSVASEVYVSVKMRQGGSGPNKAPKMYANFFVI